MLKSIEQIAKEKIEMYMRPLIINGEKITNGWPIHIAAKKAIAAYPNFENEIINMALQMAHKV